MRRPTRHTRTVVIVAAAAITLVAAATFGPPLILGALMPDSYTEIQNKARKYIGEELTKFKADLTTTAEESGTADELSRRILAAEIKDKNGVKDPFIFVIQDLGPTPKIPGNGLANVVTQVRAVGNKVTLTSVVVVFVSGGSGAWAQSATRYLCSQATTTPRNAKPVTFTDTTCPAALLPALTADLANRPMKLSDISIK